MATTSPSWANSSAPTTEPVGLCGVLTMTTAVRSSRQAGQLVDIDGVLRRRRQVVVANLQPEMAGQLVERRVAGVRQHHVRPRLGSDEQH